MQPEGVFIAVNSLGFLLLCGYLCYTDITARRLPNWALASGYVLSMLLCLAAAIAHFAATDGAEFGFHAPGTDYFSRLMTASGLATVVFAVSLTVALITDGALGWGDVKLLPLITLQLLWHRMFELVPVYLLLIAALLLVTLIAARLSRAVWRPDASAADPAAADRQALPFAPALTISFWLAFVVTGSLPPFSAA